MILSTSPRWGQAGFRNVRDGGESIKEGQEGPFFVYLVHRSFKRPSHQTVVSFAMGEKLQRAYTAIILMKNHAGRESQKTTKASWWNYWREEQSEKAVPYMQLYTNIPCMGVVEWMFCNWL